MSTLSAKEYKRFEDIKRIRPDGSEYWAARELAPVLDYAKWENFYKVIKRAMIACENSGRSTLECFPEVRKTSPMPNGGVKDILDYELSRYACYLIVQNGDPRKEVIALGQTYFAIQTYRQEVADRFNQLDEDSRRLVVRGDIKQWNQLLAETARNAGVITAEEFAIFQNAGYMGLYPNAGTPKVFICAMHPTNPECADLLSKKDSDLKKIIETRDIPCEDKTRNAAMRTAIWSYYGDDLQVNSVELDVTKGDAKPIWEKLQKYLPVYSLFQADRKNSDSDSEVQDPLHAAVKEILQDEGISQTLDHVAEIVEGKLQEVATRTLEKLREMSPDIANTLSPVIPPASSLKWADVFKSVTISGDESIPINKRGSGSKRLILLNFFRAEVERRKDEANAPGIIYAIEEPETSQHSENQKKLINALIALSTESNVQVIVTTHSAVLVNALDFKNIRLICADGSQKRVEAVRSGQLPFPSLNEVNYLAFSEISEGYHDELYGYLEEQGWLNEYKQGKTTVPYKKISANGTTREQQICMTEYIRHQIHHPENTYNARFNDSQLRRSIEDMRAFVTSKAQTPETT